MLQIIKDRECMCCLLFTYIHKNGSSKHFKYIMRNIIVTDRVHLFSMLSLKTSSKLIHILIRVNALMSINIVLNMFIFWNRLSCIYYNKAINYPQNNYGYK